MKKDSKKKIQYIWDYYKFPILAAIVVLGILITFLVRHFTAKESLLYLALVNVTAGTELTEALGDGFLDACGYDTGRNQVYYYKDLYLAGADEEVDSQYAYISRLKIMSLVDAEQLDVVLMDQKALDSFTESGYLCDLEALLAEKLPDRLGSLKDSLTPGRQGLLLDESPLIREAGFSGSVYLGILENSTHTDAAVRYVNYLIP